MKLRGFNITNAQLGWVVDCYFRVTTADQFCDQECYVHSGHRWMLVAVIRSYLAARKAAGALRARPGERAAKGWAD